LTDKDWGTGRPAREQISRHCLAGNIIGRVPLLHASSCSADARHFSEKSEKISPKICLI